MTVRRAVSTDIPRLLQLAQVEHERSRFRGARFDRAHCERGFAAAIGGMASVVLVSESGLGLIAGMVQGNLFNRFCTAYELLWYAEDGSGMELLRGLTDWARRMRAVELVVHDYAQINDAHQLSRVMARNGFSTLGTTYVKSLET